MFGAASSRIRGVWAGGSGVTDTIDFVTISITGNATDWGDTFEGVRRAYNSGNSDSHGGLS